MFSKVILLVWIEYARPRGYLCEKESFPISKKKGNFEVVDFEKV
jgi:hypothetical protein